MSGLPCHERNVERAVEALVVASERPPDPGDPEGPDGRAGDGQQRVAAERHAEEARRNRDERADDRDDAPEQDGHVVVAIEPALGTLEPLRA